MNTFAILTAATGVLALTASTAFANPQLMMKTKPGYPYPGTQATDNFGADAMLKATQNDNQAEGIDIGQIHQGRNFKGLSLLPPPSDPKQISPFSPQPASASQKLNPLTAKSSTKVVS